MLSNTGFFNRSFEQSQKKNNNREQTVIHVGGELFHALAMAFIDKVMQGQMLALPYANSLLQQLAFYFPQQTAKEKVSAETLEAWLISHPAKSEAIMCLAYTLRQMAVDELLRHPFEYKKTFLELPQQYSEDRLRHGETKLPVSVLAALVNVLPLMISLSFMEPGKELRRQVKYAGLAEVALFKLVIQVQKGAYFPQVRHVEYFTSLGTLTQSEMLPLSVNGGSLTAVYDAVAADNLRLWKRYEQYRKTLNALILDSELSLDQLQALYLEYLPPSNQSLFASLEQQYHKTIAVGIERALTEQKTQLLINALAGGLCLSQINEQQFFTALEQPVTKAAVW